MNTPKVLFALMTGVVLVASPLRGEGEVGFVEKFALAPDREAVLAQLVPGTEEYYFFHSLHYQSTGQKEKLASTLEAWGKRFPNSEQRRVIENREALLAYDADPQRTLKYLREHLGPRLDHVQELHDRKPDLPTTLDQARIARGVYLAGVMGQDGLDGLSETGMEELVREKAALRPAQRRTVLSRLVRPDVPELVELVAADLKTPESRGFGEFPIHRALLPEQLVRLGQLFPAVTNQQAYVFARIRKLAPSADADAANDPVEREAWLGRVWDYAKTLSSAFNSLKAHVLYARLSHDRTRGVYDRERFVEYLKLPRPVGYMNPRYLESADVARHAVDLNAAFDDTRIGQPPIGNDEALVREFVLHFSVDDAAWEPWTEWLRDSWAKPVFAEAKITAGVGDPEKWASLLSPSAYQALKERVDIEFPATNPATFPVDAEVSVDVVLKHAPKILVRIYEINTLGFYRSQGRQLNTDLNLDGLVANSEQTHDGESSPFKRAARTFKFPELKGKRGAWVIEFIGGGRSSRSLVRKGAYTLVQKQSAAGDELTILDESSKPARDAVAWLDGRKLEADAKDGKIRVPFTAQPGRRTIVLANAAGTFASLTEFEHHAEAYRLDAQFHVEREQWVSRRDATLAVRVAVLAGDVPVAPEVLLEPTLTLSTTTLDGITTTTETKVTGLTAGRVWTNTFTVPDRLAHVTATLRAKIEQLAKGGEKQELTASRGWDVNGIDTTDATNDGHLSRFADDYVFELLGKNGEPIPDQQVVFDLERNGYARPENIALRTDEKGRVTLGKLEGISVVRARIPNGRVGSWMLDDATRTWATVMHAHAGDAIEVPWIANNRVDAVSLLETRGGEFVADRVAMAKQAGPFVELTGLPPGDYSLRLRDDADHTIAIRITDGAVVGNWMVSTNRSLEVREPAPLQIETASVSTNGISIQLRNWTRFTRVHVAATRFMPEGGIFAGLGGFTRFAPAWATPGRLPNLYSTGREIGDEYRYILDRRYAAKFPGNMLVRPPLILNPWEKRSTDAGTFATREKQDAAATPGMAPAMAMLADTMSRAMNSIAPPQPGTSVDFLATSAPVTFNLVPDTNGVVKVPAEALGDRQHVQIYAEDPFNAVWETFAVGERPTRFRDLRLARNLDPAQVSSETKDIVVLDKGGTVALPDLQTGELETYDTVASVHALFRALNQDMNLAKFEWVTRWPSLKDEEKRAKYSEFACHELSFFLSRKDPAFFTSVIRPYLANKKDKTFLDEYLLESDLKRHLEPWAYARLNLVERALLARRLPGEAANAARHLRELWELLPSNSDEDDRLFETALRGRELETAALTPAGTKAGSTSNRLRGQRLELSDRLGEEDKPTALATNGQAFFEAAGGIGGGGRSAGRTVRMVTAANAPSGARLMARYGLAAAKESRLDSLSLGVDFDAAAMTGNRTLAAVSAYYRLLGPTKEWAENNYYRLPIEAQGPELVTINAFWRDFAAWDGKAPFLSAHVAEAHRNFTEMMLALAVLDLPFEAGAHATKTEGNAFTLTVASPAIAFVKRLRPIEKPANDAGTGLLVSEGFYRQGDRYVENGNEKTDKFVTDEFLSGVVYGAHVVVSNPGSAPAKVDLLTQIPRGALPVLGSKATRSQRVRLEPYATEQLEYHFYFPDTATNNGTFAHFPSGATMAGKAVGAAKAMVFRVVKQLSKVDTGSWEYVSQQGSEADVFAFLEKANLARLDLERVAWRARTSADFFRRLVAFLDAHHAWSEPIHRYGLVHNDAAAVREWLRHQDGFLARCGEWLDTKLAKIDPVERRTYEHLEYSPLVNQRAHRVGAEPRIANPVLRAQYTRLLGILAYRPKLDAADEMAVTYHLFLQDRVEEAMARFRGISADALATRLQHDYLRCYAAFYEEKPADARAIAAKYATHPVDRWRELFAEVSAQADEAEGKTVARKGDKPDRERQHGELAAAEPSFELKVENRTVALTWKNLKEVTLNYYLMDPEFLFSSSPFVTRDSDRFGIIQPTETATQALPAGKDTLEIALPARFAKANVLVEVLGAGQRKAQAYHANTFKLSVAESHGRLEVTDRGSDKPVTKAYVKVYARLANGGGIRFMKDGYTDLRGKFDYASVNDGAIAGPVPQPTDGNGIDHATLRPDEVSRVEKLAILVLSETHGAAVKEVDAPRR